METTLIRTAEEGGHETINPLLPAVPDLIWGAVVFVVLFIVFWKVVLPRVTATLDARSDAIEGGIQRAETAQAEATAALESYQAQLQDARGEAARIREQARNDGDRIIADKKQQAGVEAERLITAARAQIEAERLAAQASLRGEVGSLALDLASTVVGESLSDDKKASALVDRFLADLEADEKQKATK